MAAATTLPELTVADIARTLRELAARMERGEKQSPEVTELANKLAASQRAAEDARMNAIFERVIEDHREILEALAK